MDLSIIIVNYNMKSFLEQSLRTIIDASEGLETEIFVVDNDSSDGSQEMIQTSFPGVELICNDRNLGFAKANNQALRRCRGRYVLLINNDVIVHQNTLKTMVDFLDEHPEAGAAGCKILNPDGTLQLSCRRGFPTPAVAFFKIAGLSSLFPKSRLFARYNLTYLSPDETHEVDALSGSFMMVRREALNDVGLLDETFFFYGEDLDWCFRIKKAGWMIYYVPATEIIHFKSESSKTIPRTRLLVMFYHAMYIFVKKHFQKKYFFFPVWLLTLGIVFRGVFSFLVNLVKKLLLPTIDSGLVLLGLSLGIALRFRGPVQLPKYSHLEWALIYLVCWAVWILSFHLVGLHRRRKYSPWRTLLGGFLGFVGIIFVDSGLVLLGLSLGIALRFRGPVQLPKYSHLEWALIYLVCWAVWILSFHLVGLYRRRKYSPWRALLGVFLGFAGIILLVFFFKQYNFSRLAAFYAWGFNSSFIAGWRTVVYLISKTRMGGKIGRRRILIVGADEEGISFLRLLNRYPNLEYEVVGFVDNRSEVRGSLVEGKGVIGLVDDLSEVVHEYKIDEVIVTATTVPYSQMLGLSSDFRRTNLQFKLVPNSFQSMVDGKRIEGIEDLPLIDIAYRPRRIWDRIKAVFEGPM